MDTIAPIEKNDPTRLWNKNEHLTLLIHSYNCDRSKNTGISSSSSSSVHSSSKASQWLSGINIKSEDQLPISTGKVPSNSWAKSTLYFFPQQRQDFSAFPKYSHRGSGISQSHFPFMLLRYWTTPTRAGGTPHSINNTDYSNRHIQNKYQG